MICFTQYFLQMKIEIRQEQESDNSDVYRVNCNAFERDEEARLVDALRHSEAFIPECSLVALLNDQIIGHILFTKIKIRNVNGESFQSLLLAPMAVHKANQQQGIGSQLVKAGLQKAKELKYSSVIVLGHEQYYPRFGFMPASRWGIKAPYEVPDNAFMALELTANSLDGVRGTVEFPKEFEGVS